MYEIFTDICKKVIQKANREAMLTCSQYISSGHVLIALTYAGSDSIAELLRSFGAQPDKTRAAVRSLLRTEKQDLSKSPQFKQVVGYMLETAKRLNHEYIGTEHLLLGLLHDREGIAVRALEAVGVDIDRLQYEVSQRLPAGSPEVIACRKILED
jgi:ATP-dependent Clp protease ATP-binding subunit ClpC